MRKIITISREFGSGGRELGKRMADLLGFAYIDREIISEIAEQYELSESYVADTLAKKKVAMPLHYGRTLSLGSDAWKTEVNIIAAEQQLLKKAAEVQNCVIIGRNSEFVLKDMNPFSIFVYADMPSKLQRCREHAASDEFISEELLKKKIVQVDRARAKRHNYVSGLKWGQEENYRLCIDTSGCDIKQLARIAAGYADVWFRARGKRL